jgi:hypothetical protein
MHDDLASPRLTLKFKKKKKKKNSVVEIKKKMRYFFGHFVMYFFGDIGHFNTLLDVW